MSTPVSTKEQDVSNNISAVILDYGQVLARCPTVPEFMRMAQMFNVSFELFYQLWEASRGPYDRADFGAEAYWLNLAEQTNTELNAAQIAVLRQVEVEIWAHVDPLMMDWVSKLSEAGIKTGLLTNMPWDLIKYVQTCDWMKNFAFKTFSAEVKLIKPDPAIYEHTLHGLGVAASEALFIDDREINIQAARELGIRSIRFQSVGQLRKDLEALDFQILPVMSKSISEVEASAHEIKFQL